MPFVRVGSPEEIAAPVVVFASPGDCCMTGAVLATVVISCPTMVSSWPSVAGGGSRSGVVGGLLVTDAPPMQTLRVRTDGPVGELLLNRPAKLNALSATMLDELVGAAAWLDAQDEVKAVVIRGAGRAFTGGADLDAVGAPDGDAVSRRAALDRGRRAIESIAAMRSITVAAIHGHCVGGGVVLATACDLRIAAAGTRFSIPEVDLGIPLTWSGIPRLVRELGPAVTKDVVLTCRTFDAHEAQAIRLVNRVVALAELEAEALAIAKKLASQPAYSLTLTKLHVNAVAEESGSTAQSFREPELLAEALRDEESLQAMARYLEARR